MTEHMRPFSLVTRVLAGLAALLVATLMGVASPAYAATGASAPSQPVTGIRSSAADMALATKGYTYWGYYNWDDKKHSWAYETVGANDRKALPKDGQVYGFRWALVVKKPRFPRADGNFDAICGQQTAGSGKKRIAFVIDYGAQSDAVGGDSTPQPRGVCAVANDNFSVQQALEVVLPVRTDSSGLICGIDDYPSHGCGATVANPTEPPSDKQVNLALPGDSSSTANPGGQSTNNTGGQNTNANTSTDSGSGVSVSVIVVIAIVIVLVFGALVLRRRQS